MDFRLDNLFDNFEPLIILIKIRYSWEGGATICCYLNLTNLYLFLIVMESLSRIKEEPEFNFFDTQMNNELSGGSVPNNTENVSR